MRDGVLVIKKEKGYTSHDVVAKLRGILRMKRIGHTGTLDPDAEGVLPVLLGKATKLSDYLTEKQKTYETVLRLGVVTDTQDMTGSVLETHEVSAAEQEIRETVAEFLGDQQQIPPMYSALKVNGQKLCDLARAGKEIERKPRTVHFYSIEITGTNLPLVSLSVVCSRGTYIRTLCHDIGASLGCGAAMESLVRTASGAFTLENAMTLEEVREAENSGTLDRHIAEIEEILSEFPRICVKEQADRLLLNGNALKNSDLSSQTEESFVRMCKSDGTFTALYKKTENGFKPDKMFI